MLTLIRQAVDGELQALLANHTARVTDVGRAAVVRNGYLPERQVQTGIGPVTVKVPKEGEEGRAGDVSYPLHQPRTCRGRIVG